jgi:hypothetical protein
MSNNKDAQIQSPHSEKLAVPFVALLTVFTDVWEVSVRDSSDPKFSFINREPKSYGYRPGVDAFAVSVEFLHLKTPDDALAFFRRYGPFQLAEKAQVRDPRKWTAQPVRWSEIQKAQETFRDAQMCAAINAGNPTHGFVFQPLREIELHFRGPQPFKIVRDQHGKVREVLDRGYTVADDRDSGSCPSRTVTDEDSKTKHVELLEVPKNEEERSVSRLAAGNIRLLKAHPEASISDAAIVNCEDVVSAVRASIFLRRMSGFRWKRCARKGCDNVFEVSIARRGGKQKIHCSPQCAHHHAQNKYIAREKKRKRRKG